MNAYLPSQLVALSGRTYSVARTMALPHWCSSRGAACGNLLRRVVAAEPAAAVSFRRCRGHARYAGQRRALGTMAPIPLSLWGQTFAGRSGGRCPHRTNIIGYLPLTLAERGAIWPGTNVRWRSASISHGGRASSRLLRPPTRLRLPERPHTGHGESASSHHLLMTPAEIRRATREMFTHMEQRLKFRGWNILRWALAGLAGLGVIM